MALIEQQAEKELLRQIEEVARARGQWGALLLKRFELDQPDAGDPVALLAPIVEDKEGTIYRLKDGNIVVTWNGMLKATMEALSAAFYTVVPTGTARKRHQYFDMKAERIQLEKLCSRTRAIQLPGEEPPPPPPKPAPKAEVTPEEFASVAARRATRRQLHALVLEDEPFTAKLLVDLLRRNDCRGYVARTGTEALNYYVQEAPDLAYLDIMLPDTSGHEVAAEINRIDPDAFIFMVSASQKREDAERARENKARSFIRKPYSRQGITDSLALFHQWRKTGKS